MYSLNIITHPLKINKLTGTNDITVIQHQYVGPIGFRRYTIHTDDRNSVIAIAAEPFSFVVLTDVLDNYNIPAFIEMCTMFLKMRIGAQPDDFEVVKFSQPRTTYFYPTYRNTWRDGVYTGAGPYINDYLDICDEERQLLSIDPLTFLGLVPVTDDPLCWMDMQLKRPVMWNGGAVAHYNKKDSQVMQQIDSTLLALEKSHRHGHSASYGPVREQIPSDKYINTLPACISGTCTSEVHFDT
jgi:hypothetical protein